MIKIIKQISKNWCEWADKEVMIPYNTDTGCIITNNNTILFVAALILLIVTNIK